MLDRLSTYLQQPYPFNARTSHYLRVIVVFASFVALFLMIFQPFGIHQLDTDDSIYVSLSFGAVTFLSLSVFLVLTKTAPEWFDEDNWTLGKEIFFGAFNFFAVGNANYLFVNYGWYKEYMMFDYGRMMFATFAVGFFPYLFMLLTIHMRRLQQNVQMAEELTSELSHRSSGISKKVLLEGENEGERLELSPDEILFIAASGNYIEVVHTNESQKTIERTVLRSTLSRAEAVLGQHQGFLRCHRTFIVNLRQVSVVNGNSQGYRLNFDQRLEDVPVARTKIEAFKRELKKMAHLDS